MKTIAFNIPDTVDLDKNEASMRNDILCITFLQ